MSKQFFIAAGFIFLLTGFVRLAAQEPELQTRYERSSISYISAMYIPRSEAYELKTDEVDYLINTIEEYIAMPRFDFNELPEEITGELVDRARRMQGLSLDELEQALNETVVPVITDILNTQMEIRARDLVTEEQKQQFIATKARSYGITAAQLETVMNSAYIYIPYVDRVRFEEDDGTIKFHINGGLFWYHVETLETEPQVESLLKQESYSMGQGKEDSRFTYKGRILNGEEFALYSAIDNFARNLQVATRSIPEFKLSGAVQYVQGPRLEFNLGRKEGVMVDDGFYIGEQQQSSEGTVEVERVGFVRTVSVGNNHDDDYAFSRAAAVIGGRFARGMAIIEHPRLPIDIVLRPRIYQMHISAGEVGIQWPGSDYDILKATFADPYDKYTFGLDLEANYHVGRWMDIPLLVMGIGGTFSPVPMIIEMELLEDVTHKTIPFSYQVHFGIAKKYFYKRLGFVLSGKFGASVLSATERIFDHSISLSNRTVGSIFQLGLEYVASPDFYIGGYAGYQFFPRSPVWTFDVDDDSYPLLGSGTENRPKFDANGLTIGLYLHYQPPALPFDPFNLFRGATGL
ncbi:MAG TPA: hypothetical protein VKA68_16785 [bacterium]|nr:hypothetical protein [bacterium]